MPEDVDSSLLIEFTDNAEIQTPRVQFRGVNISFYKKKGQVDDDEPKKPLVIEDQSKDQQSWLRWAAGVFKPEPRPIKQVLFDVNIDMYKGVLALIGPSGSGKSTLVKLINRMHETSREKNYEMDGDILVDGESIFAKDVDTVVLRKKIGMIFQKANPFPKSIYDNVAYGINIHGLAANKEELDARVEEALTRAGLWDEVKDRLHTTNGTDLSGGQQQRLCIARAIASEPEILLMDEPTSALDPKAARKVEDLIVKLSAEIPVVLVTHKLEQARAISQETAFLQDGRVLEHDLTDTIFSNPQTDELKEFFMAEYGREVPFEPGDFAR